MALEDRPFGLALFASGRGSNAEQIIKYLNTLDDTPLSANLIVSNRQNPGVKSLAEALQIPFVYIGKEDYSDAETTLSILRKHHVDGIVLAGFLKLIPPYLIHNFPKKIVNIHPALLPKYGGPGMYGHHVHDAVFANNDLESGITIHEVNEAYDEGQVIFQASRPITQAKDAKDIAKLVLELEHFHYPKVVVQHFSQFL